MSDLIERLRELSKRRCIGTYDEAADRIEELERERDAFYMDYRMKCDEETKALQADNARLRELLRQWAFTHTDDEGAFMEVQEALAATPEQSLAAMQTDNARLRDLLNCIYNNLIQGMGRNLQKWQAKTINEALAATPKQSVDALKESE